jgi:hypothetical protein
MKNAILLGHPIVDTDVRGVSRDPALVRRRAALSNAKLPDEEPDEQGDPWLASDTVAARGTQQQSSAIHLAHCSS